MEPSNFPEANLILTAPDENPTGAHILDLPAHRAGGQIVTLWRPSWREMLSLLLYRRVWMRTLTQTTQPPVSLDCVRTPFMKVPGSRSRASS